MDPRKSPMTSRRKRSEPTEPAPGEPGKGAGAIRPRPAFEAGAQDEPRELFADQSRPLPYGGNAESPHRIDVQEILYGDFPQVTPLNPGFVPGVKRLKMTLTIGDGRSNGGTAEYVEALAGFLPSLSFHRCCGNNSMKETFFERDQRRHCAMKETEEGVDLAHLVEHVLIDVQHYIARMRICSGVTCAWNHPRDRYDIFVECLDETVGRTSAGIAVDLVEDLLAGRRPNPRYLCLIQVARIAHDHPGWPVEPRLGPLSATWGGRLVGEAVAALRRRGFLEEIPVSFNFSGRPLLCFLSDEARSPLAS